MAISSVAVPHDPKFNAIITHMARREAAMKATIFTLVLFGLLALLFGPVVISCIYWVVSLLWGFYVPWTWIFWGSCLILIPLLFWTERRTGSDYYAAAVLSLSAPLQTPLSGLSDVDALVGF